MLTIAPKMNSTEKTKVEGIVFDSIEIPFVKLIEYEEFQNYYFEPLKIALEILDFSKILKEFKEKWNKDELKDFLFNSNPAQLAILKVLTEKKAIKLKELFNFLSKKPVYEIFNSRQIAPQIAGLRIRTTNLSKESLFLINKDKDKSYSINENYSKLLSSLLKDFTIDKM